jgi:hypothetical protein
MSSLTNLGQGGNFIHGAPRRLIFGLKQTDALVNNSISIADADTLANWQTKFNNWSYLADTSDKYMATMMIREFTPAEGDQTIWEIEDYRRIMRSANLDISVSMLDNEPAYLAGLRALVSQSIGFNIVTDLDEVIGIKNGTNLELIPIKDGSFHVPFHKLGGYTEGSKNVISFRADSGTNLDNLVAVTMTDGDVTSDTDFFSLRTSTATVSSPAVTGCVFTPSEVRVDPSDPGTTKLISGITFGMITFRDQADQSAVTLAAAGSLTYNSSTGAYTVNESTLLTTLHSYAIEIAMPRYDIVFTNLCVIP